MRGPRPSRSLGIVLVGLAALATAAEQTLSDRFAAAIEGATWPR